MELLLYYSDYWLRFSFYYFVYGCVDGMSNDIFRKSYVRHLVYADQQKPRMAYVWLKLGGVHILELESIVYLSIS